MHLPSYPFCKRGAQFVAHQVVLEYCLFHYPWLVKNNNSEFTATMFVIGLLLLATFDYTGFPLYPELQCNVASKI